MAFIFRLARKSIFLVIALQAYDCITTQLLSFIFELDKRGKHRPATGKFIGFVHGVGFLVGSCLVSYDHISQRILKLAQARDILGNLLATLKAQTV